MTSSDIAKLFSALPSDDDDNYTIELKDIVLKNDLVKSEADVAGIITSHKNVKVRFAAFYALLIISREYENFTKYISYVDEYGLEFRTIKLYDIVLSTYYRNKGIMGEKENYVSAMRYGERACVALPSNLAVKHHFAELVALCLEENIPVDVAVINTAIDRLEDVIVVWRSHAKYFCTKGRLLAAKGDFTQAIANVKKALDMEKIEDKDSMIRIGQYNYYLLSINMMVATKTIDQKISDYSNSVADMDAKGSENLKKMEQNFDHVKTQYLEYLAFFSSILAFILTTVSIVSNTADFNHSAGLVLMFAGALVLVFGIFRMLLQYIIKERYWLLKTIVCLVVSLLFLALGYFIGNDILHF